MSDIHAAAKPLVSSDGGPSTPVPPASNNNSAADRPGPTTRNSNNGEHSINPRVLSDAAMLLTHSAEIGLKLPAELIVTIESSRDTYAQGKWTSATSEAFWPAYSSLCDAAKPVTAESLTACNGPEVRRTLDRYRHWTIWLIVFILPVSVVMFVNNSITTEINDRIKENDALVSSLREHVVALDRSVTTTIAAPTDQPAAAASAKPAAPAPAPGEPAAPPPAPPAPAGAATAPASASSKPTATVTASAGTTDPSKGTLAQRDALAALQQFQTATRLLYGRASLLNAFVLNAELDPFKELSSAKKRENLEIDPSFASFPKTALDKIVIYQTVRGFAKNVQQMNLIIYGAITAYGLPIVYALLGACAYALRSLSEQTQARTYRPSYAAFARISIALIGGLVVGLFNNFTQGISLSPLAIAFLVGYAVEVFFSFLDALLETLKKVRT